jgi:hypothetical protein
MSLQKRLNFVLLSEFNLKILAVFDSNTHIFFTVLSAGQMNKINLVFGMNNSIKRGQFWDK